MSEPTLKKVLDFIQKYLKFPDRELLHGEIKKHCEYKTFDYAVDNFGDIVAILRWNVDGNTWNILDFAIREDFRSRGIMRMFAERNMNKWADVEYIEYRRGLRGDFRTKRIGINKILKSKIF